MEKNGDRISFIKHYVANATHCPCLSDALNLSLTKASNIQKLRSTIDVIKTVISFTAISKRKCVLKEMVGWGLIRRCTTRWVDSIFLFCSALSKKRDALEQISS